MQKTIVLTKPEEVKPIEVKISLPSGMDLTVEVKEKLSLEEKVHVIEEIVNECVVNQFNYFNPLMLRTLVQVKTIDISTNINCDYTDLYEFYEILKLNGIFKEILPLTEYQEILNWSYECAESLCAYKNSFIGFMQNMSQNAQDTGNATQTIEQLLEVAKTVKEDPDIQKLFSEVLPTLG